MSRTDLTFKRLREKGQTALIPFIVAGDPELERTEALIFRMAESGADIIELGVPYSNPFADGPVIQAAHQRALQNGISLREVFYFVKRLKGVTIPLILMTYFNSVFHYGLKNFAEGCKESGIDGVIIPDLPPEETGAWIKEARKLKLDTILLITPSISIERIKWMSQRSRGFIYYASHNDVTGVREKLPEDLEFAVKRVKENTKRLVAVGFGISTPEQAKTVSRFADGVIVGSAIVKIIEENLRDADLIVRIGNFVSSLARVLKS